MYVRGLAHSCAAPSSFLMSLPKDVEMAGEYNAQRRWEQRLSKTRERREQETDGEGSGKEGKNSEVNAVGLLRFHCSEKHGGRGHRVAFRTEKTTSQTWKILLLSSWDADWWSWNLCRMTATLPGVSFSPWYTDGLFLHCIYWCDFASNLSNPEKILIYRRWREASANAFCCN